MHAKKNMIGVEFNQLQKKNMLLYVMKMNEYVDNN